MSEFFHYWVVGLVLIQLIALVFLLFWTKKQSPEDLAETDSMGHTYDGIEELNMPLPKWWLHLFYLTIIFALGYLLLFPGFGKIQGLLGWSATQHWSEQVAAQTRTQDDLFAQFALTPVEELVKYEEPIQAGQRLFSTHCATCHGVDAKGALGFPNLTDDDWLYGGSVEKIKETLIQGRMAMMPSFAHLGQEKILVIAAYVKNLSHMSLTSTNATTSSTGKTLYESQCAVCHGVDAKGNQLLGAPNLSDDIWLYGGSLNAIRETLMLGRRGEMPSFKETLGEDKIHVVTAYLYQLNQTTEENKSPDQL